MKNISDEYNQQQLKENYSIHNNKVISDKKITRIRNELNNNDIMGILNFGDVETLVARGHDNSFYLNHLIDGSINVYGTPFMDHRNDVNSKKIIIYGHNANYYNTKFKSLLKYLSKDYYDDNSIITFETDNYLNKYKIFSVALYRSDFDYYDMNITDYNTHFNKLKSRSLYDTGVLVDGRDDIIVLQTCSNNRDNEFVIICAKKF